MRRRLVTFALLAAALAAPTQVSAQELGEAAEPITVRADETVLTYMRVPPPTTSPVKEGPQDTLVAAAMSLRGVVLHGEGNLLLVSLGGDEIAVLQMPADDFSAEMVPFGSIVDATGLATFPGPMMVTSATIWPR